MPSHLYRTMNNPPKFYDIVLAHALEVCIAAFSVTGGAVVGLNAHDLAFFTSTTPLRLLPIHLLYGLAIFLVFGGTICLVGLLVRRKNIRAELNIEQTGWVVLSAGWGTYAWAAIHYADGAAMSYIFAGFVTFGCALRAVALFATEKQLDAVIRAVEDTGPIPVEEAP